ncbi:hypothetical protein ABT214_03240 [Micromonospora purpureochromogenes]|uniref:hypothetical protein n=1 Tax=Micromonospora purpureochromogenes TaxID=47872 RepID=UPI00331AE444
MRKLVNGLAGGAALLTALAYSPPARRWYLRHGATSEEVSRTMPGDELLAEADLVSTRSITIDAPPTGVRPWLVQMGSGRGGAYTYDWVENLFGLRHAQRARDPAPLPASGSR